MVRSQITALLIRLHRLCLSTPSVEAPGYFTQLTNRFLSLLEREEGKFQRAGYYSSALSVSSRVLVDTVLTETGKSPSAWIRDRTMLEARRLLIFELDACSHLLLEISQMPEFHCNSPLCRKGMVSSRNTVLACPKDRRQTERGAAPKFQSPLRSFQRGGFPMPLNSRT
jgi:AraC-like DNA-binding protein